MVVLACVLAAGPAAPSQKLGAEQSRAKETAKRATPRDQPARSQADNPSRPVRVLTPDGSVFVLQHRPTRGLVYWASWFRMGRRDEAPGQEGLAEACALASLAGTTTHGTSEPKAEAEALEELDQIRKSIHDATLSGRTSGEIASLRARYDDMLARCRNLGTPLAFRRLLSALPATPPRVTCKVDGYLFESCLPADRLGDFAVLMEGRRSDAVLRRVHDKLLKIRKRLRQQSKAEGAAHRQALALTALEVDPLRRVLIPPRRKSRYITREEALRFYREHHRPGLGTTVILGDFDVKSLSERLRRIFVSAKGSTGSIDASIEEPPQMGPRFKVLISQDPRLLWAWRPPDDARLAPLEILGIWLQRHLEREFARERGLAKTVRVEPRFPGASAPAVFLVEMSANNPFEFRQLERDARTYFEALERSGPPAEELARAAKTSELQGHIRRDRPELQAANLALRVGRDPFRVLPAKEKPLEAASEIALRLFTESKRTVVTTRSPKSTGDDR